MVKITRHYLLRIYFMVQKSEIRNKFIIFELLSENSITCLVIRYIIEPFSVIFYLGKIIYKPALTFCFFFFMNKLMKIVIDQI